MLKILDMHLGLPDARRGSAEGLAPWSVRSMIRRQRAIAHAERAGAPCWRATECGQGRATRRKRPPEIPEIPEIPLPDSGASESFRRFAGSAGTRVALEGPGGNRRKLAETPGREFAPETVGIFLTSAGGQRQGAARKPSAEIAGNAEVPPLGRRAIAYLIPVVLNEVTSTSFWTSTVRNEHKGLAFAPAACPQSTVEA
jgi:hypothetical protein